MPKKRDSDLTDAELAAWLARWLAWQPTWQQYQDWIREIGWRAGIVQAANQELLESRRRGAA